MNKTLIMVLLLGGAMVGQEITVVPCYQRADGTCQTTPLTNKDKAEDAEAERINDLFSSLLQRTDLTAGEILSLGEIEHTWPFNPAIKYKDQLEAILKAANDRKQMQNSKTQSRKVQP